MKPSEIEHLDRLYSNIGNEFNTRNAYLSAIFGMWSNTYGIPHIKNPMKVEGLIEFWSCGWRCSEQCRFK